MDSCTGTLSALHATVMDNFPTNAQIKKPKQIILEITRVMMMQTFYVIKKHGYFWTLPLQIARQIICIMLKT